MVASEDALTFQIGYSAAQSVKRRRRDGCSECKRKKVKCDFKRPVCSRCIRFPRECQYGSNFVTVNSQSASRENFISSGLPTRRSLARTPDCRRHPATENSLPLTIAKASLLPPQVDYIPSTLTSTSNARFLMHHLVTQTSTVLFPLASRYFVDRLLSSAMETPHLLHALLASACSHHARLLSDTSEPAGNTILFHTNSAIAGLRAALSDKILNAESAMTAMALCTNDVCDGNLDLWRTHLTGVKELLNSLLKKMQVTCSLSDPFVLYLVKWFATLDVSAGLSGLHESCVPDGRYWFLNGSANSFSASVDDICGYSLDLMPILTEIGNLARLRYEWEGNETSIPPSTEILARAQDLETRISSLQHGTVQHSTRQRHEAELAEELQHTHSSFVHAALLHLHRRVQLLSKDHPKVRADIDNIMKSVEKIRPFSSANILVLWPIFSAGCETDNIIERDLIKERMSNMRSLGMGNFTRARDVLSQFWDAGTDLPWDIYLANSGIELVLF
ncbi:fungal-specific transcription factor domain-containing protein [Lipomyces kononenkoae]|uniref:Fungal-specific transcription factor domain-containing protein n=1 Tax=Lipomyces kononenkoae TaxID=34357 RepID=A0ACC3TBQ1_LIPKO